MSSIPAPGGQQAPDFETVLKQAKSLPKEQQLRLLDELAALHDDRGDIDPELRTELAGRVQSVLDGSAVLVDHDEMMRDLRTKFAER